MDVPKGFPNGRPQGLIKFASLKVCEKFVIPRKFSILCSCILVIVIHSPDISFLFNFTFHDFDFFRGEVVEFVNELVDFCFEG